MAYSLARMRPIARSCLGSGTGTEESPGGNTVMRLAMLLSWSVGMLLLSACGAVMPTPTPLPPTPTPVPLGETLQPQAAEKCAAAFAGQVGSGTVQGPMIAMVYLDQSKLDKKY